MTTSRSREEEEEAKIRSISFSTPQALPLVYLRPRGLVRKMGAVRQEEEEEEETWSVVWEG